MRLFIFIFCLVPSLSVFAQNPNTHEFRDYEVAKELIGNGFDHIEAIKAEMQYLPFGEQSEFLIRKLGGKRITLYGMIFRNETYGKRTQQFYNAYRIVNLVSFLRNPELEGLHKTLEDRDGQFLKKQELSSINFTTDRTPGILLRELEVGDAYTYEALRKYSMPSCANQMDVEDIKDLFNNSQIINEQEYRRGDGVQSKGILKLEVPYPDQFECVVKISGILEFDGEFLFLDDWSLIEF